MSLPPYTNQRHRTSPIYDSLCGCSRTSSNHKECAGIPTGPGEARSSGTPRCRFLPDRLRRTSGSAAFRSAHFCPGCGLRPPRGSQGEDSGSAVAFQAAWPTTVESLGRDSVVRGAVWVTPARCGQAGGQRPFAVHQLVHAGSAGVIHAAGSPEPKQQL